MSISDIPPCDLDGLWLHICASTCPFQTPSPVIKMAYDCAFVQVHVHFRHHPLWSRWFMIVHLCKYMSISDTFPRDQDGLWLCICASTCPFQTPSPVIKMVYDCAFVQVHVHFRHLPPWSRWFIILHSWRYMYVSLKSRLTGRKTPTYLLTVSNLFVLRCRCCKMPGWCYSGWSTAVHVAVIMTVGMGLECWLEFHTSSTPKFCGGCSFVLFFVALTFCLLHLEQINIDPNTQNYNYKVKKKEGKTPCYC